ncbi:MAG: hypothetical protein A3H35_13070 [Betaproteobacteria bacterium RIFCSPLOWO2_02_FULL_62_17]|nr:MAG: hypothetical protein A3H35_13070 [Betaproteobacteria bacterium RIFCSPLOWO2_02_FULL_62_17]
MQVSVEATCATDEPFLVSRDAFLRLFDQHDFHCRDRKKVEPAYSEEWFTGVSGEIRGFLLPAVQFIAGKTQFISGRHRTAVLLPYLTELPIAFATINPVPEEFRLRLQLQPLVWGAIIEIPGLPMARFA